MQRSGSKCLSGGIGNLGLVAVLCQAVLGFLFIVVAGHLSDRLGRKNMYIIGCVFLGAFGFIYFAMLDTKVPALIFIAIALSLLPTVTYYGPEVASSRRASHPACATAANRSVTSSPRS